MPVLPDYWLGGGFWVGLHVVSHAACFERSFISVNRLYKRRSPFGCGKWIMDSGAFTQVTSHGRFLQSVATYAAEIDRWARYGDLVAAVGQDYMCEPKALRKTGLTVSQHQARTINRYDLLLGYAPKTYILPVLQGYEPREYVSHLRQYDGRLAVGAWVGVGSVCKRNARVDDVYCILDSILQVRPDLRLHGFGLKTTALADRRVLRRLWSADSMAWSFAARVEGRGRDANKVSEARKFYDQINAQVAMVKGW